MAPTLEYTSEQSAALTTWGASVALSAGAGCGKTFVLTRRFLAHLDPADRAPDVKLDEIVAITFTDAAARELRDRVRRTCFERLSDPAAKDHAHWLRLLRSLDGARISTIHALCSRLIRTHAIELGLDPTFRVLDAPASAVMQIEVLDDVLREKLAARDDDVMRLAADYRLGTLKEMIRALLSKARTEEFSRWNDQRPEELLAIWDVALNDLALPQSLTELASSSAVATVLRLLQERSFDRELKPSFAQAREALIDKLPRLVEFADSPEELRDIRESAKVQGICTKKDWSDEASYQAYTAACKVFRDELDKILKLQIDPEAAMIAAENGLRLMRITSDVADAYDKSKQAQAVIDFDDQLFHARRLLTDEQFAEARQQWQQQVRMLLVDEFQDTDQVQVDIVKALVGDGLATGGLFFVGDFKQSIYRFRGAEPRVFAALAAEVPRAGRLALTTNFRSQPAILDFVNALFGRVFDGYEALRPKRPQATPRPAVEFLWREVDSSAVGEANEQPKRKTSVDALRREEAKQIAQRLRAMFDHGESIVASDGQPRVVRPGDVVILFRALSDLQFYEKALQDAQIDYYLVGGHAFYTQQEVFDVLNLLRAVTSACDDVSLAGVLRSPFFSLADETLYWLVEQYGSLNGAIAAGKPPRELTPAEQAKFAAAVVTIHELRQSKDLVSPAVLLQTALDRTGYDAVLLAEFLGERKLANLHKLLEQARAIEHSGGGLDAFLEQLTEFTARAPKEAPAATNPETANVVKLMSIHMAKGLEFPVVVVADLDRKLACDAPAAVFDDRLGPLVKLPDSQDSKSTVGLDIYKQLHKPEEEGEFDRLFYVACTRAADYLVLSAGVNDLDKPAGTWLKRLAEYFDLRTGTFRDASGGDLPLVVVNSSSERHKRGQGRGGSPRADLLKLVADTELLAEQSGGESPPAVDIVAPDRRARQRFTVTRLSGEIRAHMSDADEDGTGATVPGGGKWLDPLGLGTLVHAVLERVRFDQPNPVWEWCELLAPLHMDEDESDAAAETRAMVEPFLASPRCAELAIADCVKREIEFVLRWPVGAENMELRYLQGYIDCIYRDAAGGWHLLDFKTNQLAGKTVSQVAQAYRLQLAVYALAMEQSLGERPTELVLHFLRTGEEHRFPWDDASRTEAIAQIDAAIAAELLATD